MSHPLGEWTFDPAIVASLALCTGVYVQRFRHARAEAGGRGAGVREASAFAGAILMLAIALISPVDWIGERYLFSVHMVQHLLIGDIAPLLVLLSLSRVIMRPATRRLMGLERRLGALASPFTFIALWLVLLYVWHIPAVYNATLTHPLLHAFEHACFFAGGLCVWWPLVQPVPMRRRLSGLSTFAYLFSAKLGAGVLGIFLTWSQTVAYTFYAHVPRVSGLSTLQDQNVGGAVMTAEQSVVLATALVILLVRMLVRSEEEERRRERLEDAAAA